MRCLRQAKRQGVCTSRTEECSFTAELLSDSSPFEVHRTTARYRKYEISCSRGYDPIDVLCNAEIQADDWSVRLNRSAQPRLSSSWKAKIIRKTFSNVPMRCAAFEKIVSSYEETTAESRPLTRDLGVKVASSLFRSD